MPDGVGQRLLDHPVHGGRHRRGHRRTVAGFDHRHLDAGVAHLGGQPVETLQPTDGFHLGTVAQHVDQRLEVGHRPAAHVLRQP
jgi:hypothetical protein